MLTAVYVAFIFFFFFFQVNFIFPLLLGVGMYGNEFETKVKCNLPGKKITAQSKKSLRF